VPVNTKATNAKAYQCEKGHILSEHFSQDDFTDSEAEIDIDWIWLARNAARAFAMPPVSCKSCARHETLLDIRCNFENP